MSVQICQLYVRAPSTKLGGKNVRPRPLTALNSVTKRRILSSEGHVLIVRVASCLARRCASADSAPRTTLSRPGRVPSDQATQTPKDTRGGFLVEYGRRKSLLRRGALVGFIALLLLLPSSALAWTRYQYFSGTSQGGYLTGVVTSGYLDRQYNNAYHSGADYWHVIYDDSGGRVADAYSYVSPTSLGPSSGYTSYAVRSGCEVTIANTSGVAYSCATTVP